MRKTVIFFILSIAAGVLAVLDLTTGSVSLSPGDVWAALFGGDCSPEVKAIVCDIRLIKMTVAVIAGAALPVCGLQMQTLFRNPLAGPYVLGISSGASLGVALFILAAPMAGASALSSLGLAGAAWLGAGAVMLIVLAAARRIRDIMVILILGMMIGAGISAVVQILQYTSEESALKSFVVWTLGSLGNVTSAQLPWLAVPVIMGLTLSVLTVKALNMLLLGEDYAVTMGLNLKQTRMLLFLATILLAGSVTAFCGPISFIGLAVPHIARMTLRSADNRVLLPSSILVGIIIMLACDIIAKQAALPLNALTALIGIPVVIWIACRVKG